MSTMDADTKNETTDTANGKADTTANGTEEEEDTNDTKKTDTKETQKTDANDITKNPDYVEISAMIKAHKNLLTALSRTPYDKDVLTKNLSAIRDDGYKITMWDELYEIAKLDMEKKKVKFDLLHSENLIDYDEVEKSIKCVTASTIKEDYNRYEEERQDGNIPKRMIYRLWEHMFLKSVPHNNELLQDTLSKEEKKQRDGSMEVKKKYLTSLTDQILTMYRDEIVINDAFLYKCFEHNLEKILTVLLQTGKFYNVQIEKGTLLDLYFVYACDLSNVPMLIKLLPEMNIHHLEYILRYGTYDILKLIYRYKKMVPAFNANMRILDRILKKDWRLVKLFDRWRKENPPP